MVDLGCEVNKRLIEALIEDKTVTEEQIDRVLNLDHGQVLECLEDLHFYCMITPCECCKYDDICTNDWDVSTGLLPCEWELRDIDEGDSFGIHEGQAQGDAGASSE